MDLSFLEPLYKQAGPYVSLYLDTAWTTEDSAQVVRLRWRALREELTAQRADPRTVAAVEEAVETEITRRHPGGLVIFAVGGEVILTERLRESPPGELAQSAPLPHVLPLVVRRGERVPYLVAVVDRLGAEITSVAADGERRSFAVRGDEDYPVRKVSAGDWNQSRFQRAAEEVWRANAKKIGREIDHEVSRGGVEVVVLAGDPQARTNVMDELAHTVLTRVVETTRGSLGSGSDDRSFDAEIDRILWVRETERVTAAIARFHEQLGRGDRAIEGLSATVAALRRAQVDTLLLEDHPDSSARLAIGPDPTHIATSADQLRELGVAEPAEDRADAALVRALAATGADIVVAPRGELGCGDGIGALLRYADPSTAR